MKSLPWLSWLRCMDPNKEGQRSKHPEGRKRQTQRTLYSRQISSSYRLLDAEDLDRIQRNWTLSLIMPFSSVVVKSARLWVWHLSSGLLCQSFMYTHSPGKRFCHVIHNQIETFGRWSLCFAIESGKACSRRSIFRMMTNYLLRVITNRIGLHNLKWKAKNQWGGL